jgi:hypothetical protein
MEAVAVKQQAHTPGPWSAQGFGVFAHLDRRDSSHVLTVATCENAGPGMAYANAKFIVRACNAHDDLLAALIAIEKETRDVLGSTAETVNAKARAAIAKAAA